MDRGCAYVALRMYAQMYPVVWRIKIRRIFVIGLCAIQPACASDPEMTTGGIPTVDRPPLSTAVVEESEDIRPTTCSIKREIVTCFYQSESSVLRFKRFGPLPVEF